MLDYNRYLELEKMKIIYQKERWGCTGDFFLSRKMGQNLRHAILS